MSRGRVRREGKAEDAVEHHLPVRGNMTESVPKRHGHAKLREGEGVHVAQWAKRPPLKLKVPGSNPRGWFNGRRAGNRDPFRWLETARGLEPIRLIGRAQCFPGRLAASSL